MTFEKEFEKAISHLPSKEKDKLILRLLKKDLDLANRLYFELVDNQSVEERREKMKQRVINRSKYISEVCWTIGYLKMEMRYLSGEITEHVRITKDKYGEASLNLLMLNEILFLGFDEVSATPKKAMKMGVYIIAKVFKILMIINKLHEDYLIEFRQGLVKLGELIGQHDFIMKAAIDNGFDINWLLESEIPENIVQIHKDLRSEGYLK